MKNNNNKKILGLALSAALTLGLLTSCGGAATQTQAPAESKAAEPAQSQAAEPAGPKTIKEGKLVMGTSADYPPYEFHILDNGEDKIVGLEVGADDYVTKPSTCANWSRGSRRCCGA